MITAASAFPLLLIAMIAQTYFQYDLYIGGHVIFVDRAVFVASLGLDAEWRRRLESNVANISAKVDELYSEKQKQIGRRELYADIAKWTTWLVGALALVTIVAKALGHGD